MMPRAFLTRALTIFVGLMSAVTLPAAPVGAQGVVLDGTMPQPLPLFPADNWWNLDVSQAPLDPGSTNFINFIGGASRRLHPDWGGSAFDPGDPFAIYGIPYIVVPGNQPLVPVTFTSWPQESDAGAPGRPAGYPIPGEAKVEGGWIEGGAPGLQPPDGDRHMLIVDRDNRIVYELYQAYWNAGLNRWEAASGAVWPLTTNRRRTEGDTSADAAGLAILPGLVRYDEAFGTDPIRHAFRVTVQATNGHVFPASHTAGGTANALPMGARLRMKASVNISGYPAHLQRIFQAMKTYGLIVADNGSNMFITGSSDPRWEDPMDDIVEAFHGLHANQFEVVQLGWNPPPTVDTDGDGLTDGWETSFGLDPNSNSGVNGASGDPDGDGVTNAAERNAGTHPRGFEHRLFAEGVSNTFFTTRLAALNLETSPAHVLFRFLRTSGAPVTHAVTIAPQSRITLDPASAAGMTEEPFSTVVESDLPVVVDRTVSWDRSGYGSHAETSIPNASTTWFLAEGATHGTFDLFYLIQNPGATDASVTVRYLRPAPLTPLTKTYVVGANRRYTIVVDNEVISAQSLASTDVSAAITSTVPVVVERAMYMTNGGEPFGAGHESAGVTAPALSWFLAEGATGSFFDMFILIANPDPTNTATVQANYLLSTGVTVTKSYSVAPSSRRTIYVDAEQFPGGQLLANAALSTVLTSTNSVPIVVERAMWWPGGFAGPVVRGAQLAGCDADGHGVGARRRRGRRHGRYVHLHPGGQHGRGRGKRPGDDLRRRRRHRRAHVQRAGLEPLQRRPRRRLRRCRHRSPHGRARREPGRVTGSDRRRARDVHERGRPRLGRRHQRPGDPPSLKLRRGRPAFARPRRRGRARGQPGRARQSSW